MIYVLFLPIAVGNPKQQGYWLSPDNYLQNTMIDAVVISYNDIDQYLFPFQYCTEAYFENSEKTPEIYKKKNNFLKL